MELSEAVIRSSDHSGPDSRAVRPGDRRRLQLVVVDAQRPRQVGCRPPSVVDNVLDYTVHL